MEAPISVSLGAMSSLVGKLEYLLKSQHLLRSSVRKDMELLKEDLERINTLLQEHSNEDDPNRAKKYWMKEVREVSYDIEDYIDKLMYSEAKIGSFVGVIPRLKISKLPSTLNCHRPRTIAKQIQELRARLEEAGERHMRYVLDNNSDSPSSSSYIQYGRSITVLHGEASRLLVGIDDSREKLIKLLNDGEKQLKVISVFGIGGIGKTTLVKELLENHAGQFGLRAFVRVSRKPDTRSLLCSIISQIRCHRPFDAAFSVQELISCLNEHLQNRRYLIVIDDLWGTAVWDILLHAFPDSNQSSRIITTTAVKNVAMTCCGDRSDYVLMMERINKDDSRKLFFTRVFGSEDKCPRQFKEASYEIVRQCGGVPLAIVNVAGFLASQPDKPDLWDHVQKSLSSNLISICLTTEGIVNVIKLCYNGLPHCLKTCLQYVTLYPENCTIWKDDVVRRWVAEGFIGPKEGNGDMEAVAESYFEELVYRGMIQPIDVNYNDEVLSCRVHNLVFDLLIKNSAEDNFVTTIDYSQDIRELSAKVRRLFLFFSTAKYAAKLSDVTLSQVRSLAFYGLIKCMPSILEFEFLRVLFLHFVDGYSGHTTFNLTGIRRLFQLRYLKVTCDFSLQLPTHIEGLHLLETLELDAKSTPIPADVVRLRHLSHLRLPSKTNLPDEVGRMTSLRTLKCFDLCSNLEDKVRSLAELTNLQELQIICTTVPSDDSVERKLRVLCSILGSFCNLKSLALIQGCSFTDSSSIVVDSGSTSSPPVYLERFEIHPAICTFSGLPRWIRTLGRLLTLKIAVTNFLQNDMDSLGGLPGLTVLSLDVQGPTVHRIIFNSGMFPALKCLRFRCNTIFGFVFQEEAMPNLRRLELCFKAHGGQNALITLASTVHLLNLQEIAIRVGVATCAEEYHRRAAETAFRVAFIEHRRKPNINIQYVNWAKDHHIQQTCHFNHEILEQTLPDHTNYKYSDCSRTSIFSDVTVSSSDVLSSAASSERRTGAEVMDMVNSTEATIHELSSISDSSGYAGVQIRQVESGMQNKVFEHLQQVRNELERSRKEASEGRKKAELKLFETSKMFKTWELNSLKAKREVEEILAKEEEFIEKENLEIFNEQQKINEYRAEAENKLLQTNTLLKQVQQLQGELQRDIEDFASAYEVSLTEFSYSEIKEATNSGEVNTSELIGGIGRELAISCLLRIPRSYYYDVACVNRSFYSLVRSGELYRLRREAKIVEQMIYCSCNVLEWDGFDPCRQRWFSIPSMPPIECFTLADKESLAVGTNILVFGRGVEAHVMQRYSLLTNSWTTGEMMNTPRCLFGSASFGEKAIVAGGIGENGTLRSAELYDSEMQTWTTLPSMNKARQMCSGFFMDGKFYIIGGKAEKSNEILSCAEEFDLENGTWRLIPDMARGLNGGSGAPPLVAVVNNDLYAADYASKEVRKYDKENNAWITLGLLPGRYTSVHGWGLAFRSCGDMLIVVIGGMSLGDSGVIEICSWVPNNGPPDWKIIGTRNSGSFVYNCAVMSC